MCVWPQGHQRAQGICFMIVLECSALISLVVFTDDWSNESDGWGDESIDESWDKLEETTKGSSKKEGTTQTTQTTRAGGASLKTGIYEPLALDNYVYPPY